MKSDFIRHWSQSIIQRIGCFYYFMKTEIFWYKIRHQGQPVHTRDYETCDTALNNPQSKPGNRIVKILRGILLYLEHAEGALLVPSGEFIETNNAKVVLIGKKTSQLI